MAAVWAGSGVRVGTSVVDAMLGVVVSLMVNIAGVLVLFLVSMVGVDSESERKCVSGSERLAIVDMGNICTVPAVPMLFYCSCNTQGLYLWSIRAQ
jgi:hypothetical protein